MDNIPAKRIMNHFMYMCALMVLMVSYQKTAVAESKVQPQSAQASGWKTYEDATLKFSYAPDWTVTPTIATKFDRTWGIWAPPLAGMTTPPLLGTITIGESLNQKEKRPLEKIFASKEWGLQKPVAQPRKVRSGKGKCLAYKTEGVGSSSCGDPSDPKNKDRWCLEVYVHMHCYNDSGHYFTIHSQLGSHWAGESNELLDRNTKVVEQTLKTLEFK